MSADDRLNTGHAAITHFNGISVADFMQYCDEWKMFVQKFEELFPNVGTNGIVQGRIKPCNFAFPI